MIGSKHCCSGVGGGHVEVIPDIQKKLHKSLKEIVKLGMKIFLPFPKPSQGIEHCQRWINACSFENFTVHFMITINKYICALH